MEPTIEKPARKKCLLKPMAGITEFAECLEPDSQNCSYARSCGFVMLCFRSDWQEIMSED